MYERDLINAWRSSEEQRSLGIILADVSNRGEDGDLLEGNASDRLAQHSSMHTGIPVSVDFV